MMRLNKGLKYFFSLVCVIVLQCCTDDPLPRGGELAFEEGELSEVELLLPVSGLKVGLQTGTRAPVPSEAEHDDSAEEKAVNDFWLFQYDASTGDMITHPRYYEFSDASHMESIRVKLRVGTPSVIYVLANTGEPEWITASNEMEFSTIEMLKRTQLPDPSPLRVGIDDISIPMQGELSDVVVLPTETIEIPLTRMYAKIIARVKFGSDDKRLRSLDFRNIPWHCSVEPMVGLSDLQPAFYPVGTEWISRAFPADEEIQRVDGYEEYVIYVPENIQGENRNTSLHPEQKSDNPPANAMSVNFRVRMKNYDGSSITVDYIIYPGENNYNNFNVRRNNVYRLNIDINNTYFKKNIPSSNCFIIEPGQLLGFEPYYRVEQGGGYDFKNYLNEDDPTGSKKIDHVKILWQTKDAIGDNSDAANPKVWMAKDAYTLATKIYVKANKEGNALIAAYNKNNLIIWSWHIWITDKEPDNYGKAIVYKTYRWDHTGIHVHEPRISGYSVMPCNIGALDFEPSQSEYHRTFGMLYQWGRKDPFPAPIRACDVAGPSDPLYLPHDYTNDAVGTYYDNAHNPSIRFTSKYDHSALFHTTTATNIEQYLGKDRGVPFSIENPTVYVAGYKDIAIEDDFSRLTINNPEHYPYDGDWNPMHDDKLWGALPPDINGSMEHFKLNIFGEEYGDMAIFDNYGEKSIFDPCPSGWRVPPDDLWMGFTNTGANPAYGTSEYVNFDESMGSIHGGLFMYLTEWHSGPTSYFPTPGCIRPDGRLFRVGACGNYHSATAEWNQMVNCLHIHNDNAFKIFETSNYMYRIKSLAGPVRCVRDTK